MQFLEREEIAQHIGQNVRIRRFIGSHLATHYGRLTWLAAEQSSTGILAAHLVEKDTSGGMDLSRVVEIERI